MPTYIKGNDTSTFGGTITYTAPAFSAYKNAEQTGVSANTWTKVQIDTEVFDSNSCYDTSTYRFTPTVAGYYQVNGHVGCYQPSAQVLCAIYKNGSIHKWGTYINRLTTGSADMDTGVSSVVYLNGSTDYIELYGYQDGASPKFYGNNVYSGRSYFDAFLVRAV